MKKSLFFIFFIVCVVAIFFGYHTMFADKGDDRFKSWGDTIYQYIEKNMYSEALHEMTEYSAEAQKTGNIYAQGRSYLFAGRISDVLDNHEQAAVLYKQSVSALTEAGYASEAIPVYRNLALLYLNNEQQDSALHYIDKCDKLADTPQSRCSIYSIYSLIYYTRSDSLAVNQFMERADEVRAKVDTLNIDEYYFMKSLYYELKEFSGAKQSYDLAFSYADSLNNENWKSRRVSDIYLAKGDYENSYMTMRENYDHARRTLSYRLIEMYSEYKAHNDNFHLKAHKADMLWELVMWIVIGVVLTSCIGILVYLRNRNNYVRILEKEKEEALRATELKTTVIQNMRHEIRTPFNAILGFNQLLANADEYGLTPEEQQDYMNHVDKNVAMVRTILDDLLDISRMGTGQPDMNISQTDVSEVVENVFFNAELTVHEGVALINKLPERGRLFINADPMRLQQLFQNLMNNACKYTDQGSITFSYEDRGDTCAFFVEDTGKGIPPEAAERVFARFEKLGSQVQGMGLGLSICRTIATAMHGEIHVDKNHTGGCRMVVTLPKDTAAVGEKQGKCPMASRLSGLWNSFINGQTNILFRSKKTTAAILALALSLSMSQSLNATPQNYRSDFRTWEDSIYKMIDRFRFQQAFDELERFRVKVEETNDNIGRFLYYRLNGDIYRVMDDFPKAVTNYKLSLQGDLNGVDSLTRATSYRRTAYCYLQVGNINLDSILYFGQRCIELSPTPRMKRVIGAMEGMYYLKRAQDYDTARKIAKRLMQIKGAEKVFTWDFDDYYYLISFYYETSNPQLALAYADSITEPMTRNKKLQYLYVKQKDYVNALKYLELSIKDEENFRMDRLSSLISTHINLAGNQQLESENQQLENARKIIAVGITGFIFLLFVGFMYFHIRTRNHYAREVAHERESAIRANRLKDSIIKNVRKEMRKPLNEIASYSKRAAGLGHSLLSPEEKKDFAETMDLNMTLMTKQIDHLLELASRESEL